MVKSRKAKPPGTARKKKRADHQPGYRDTWSSYSHSLERDEKVCLLKIASIETAAPAAQADLVNRVEYYLGWFPGAREAVDKAPGASNIAAGIELLREKGIALWHAADEANAVVLGALERQGLDTVTFLGQVGSLVVATNRALKAMQGQPSATAGRPKSAAFRMLVARLRDIFRIHYTGTRDTGRERRGAVQKLSPFEKAEGEFVEAAVASLARIKVEYPQTSVREFFDDTLLSPDDKLEQIRRDLAAR